MLSRCFRDERRSTPRPTRPSLTHLNVPKRDLVATTTVMPEQHRIRIAAGLPDIPVLAKELEDFRGTISDNGHPTYGPASSQGHDDLLLALSLALWAGERRPPASR